MRTINGENGRGNGAGSGRAGGASRSAAFSLIAVLLVQSALAQVNQANEVNADQRFSTLMADHWEWTERDNPESATLRGNNRYNDRLTDQSPEAVQARRAHWADLLKQLKSFDPSQLTAQNRVSLQVLTTIAVNRTRVDSFFSDLPFGATDSPQMGGSPVTQMSGPQFSLPLLAKSTPFGTVADYEAYLKRLGAIPRLLGQYRQQMQAAVDAGWLQPAVAVQRVPEQLDAQSPADPAQSPLFLPFSRFPPEIAEADQKRLANSARQLLSEQVMPAFRDLKQFYQTTYLPAAGRRKALGATKLPGGADFYQALVASSTTTALTAREIRDLGLREVARIRSEMESVMARTGFKGSRPDFVRFLHESPQFYYDKPEDMLTDYRDIAKRADAELPKLFAELPRLPYGIRAMPAYECDNAEHYIRGSGDGTRAGFFEANVNHLRTRPKYNMEDLLLHEAVPGHHLQIARAQELKDLPDFRRFGFFVAYSEGWGLYAESLGDEMGFYADPYSKFGQLSGEMMRACRLVVDTGLHAFGWERDRAILYLIDNAGLNEDFAKSEVDRYIVWPGQALGYKIGELRIKALRAKAKAALGDRFDLRRFHNALIDDGPLPLDALESRIDEWIAARKSEH
ncbi:MAG TPA: DUF885 domain-containing protein [Burkholderiaceae bacterium]|nr:DUF885 domain-containing protein [Burkholderiaceae bacterium]